MRPRTARGLFLAAVAITLAGCAAGSGPPTRKGPYGSVDVGLAAPAAAFEAYTRRAAGIDAAFAGPDDISRDLQVAAGYEPHQLETGMIAFAALAAMQEPAFVAGVRRLDARDLARRLAADPDAAFDLPGASAAAGRASAALARRGAALNAAGLRVKTAAYSVQRQAWSKTRIPNGPQRLAAVKQAAGYRPDPSDRSRLGPAVSESARRSGAGPVVARSVAVAALTVLGQDAAARPLMSEPRSTQCLRIAKLNFHQCLAAAGTHYEDIYCLGLHAMADPGQCVIDATRPSPARRAALD